MFDVTNDVICSTKTCFRTINKLPVKICALEISCTQFFPSNDKGINHRSSSRSSRCKVTLFDVTERDCHARETQTLKVVESVSDITSGYCRMRVYTKFDTTPFNASIPPAQLEWYHYESERHCYRHHGRSTLWVVSTGSNAQWIVASIDGTRSNQPGRCRS
jgi:hypothetical protein